MKKEFLGIIIVFTVLFGLLSSVGAQETKNKYRYIITGFKITKPSLEKKVIENEVERVAFLLECYGRPITNPEHQWFIVKNDVDFPVDIFGLSPIKYKIKEIGETEVSVELMIDSFYEMYSPVELDEKEAEIFLRWEIEGKLVKDLGQKGNQQEKKYKIKIYKVDQ